MLLKIINNPSEINFSSDLFKNIKNEINQLETISYDFNCKLKSLSDILSNLGFTRRIEQENDNDKHLFSHSNKPKYNNDSNLPNNIGRSVCFNNSNLRQKNLLNNKVLIFSQFNSNLQTIYSFLLDCFFAEDQVKIYSSKLNEKDRFALVEEFNTNPEFCVFLLNTNSGGLGLNLTAANIVIMYDHSWNPMKDLQAMDRAHRLGQKKVVEVFRLIVAKTIEEQMISLQTFKKYIANAIVKSTDTSDTNININSFMESFETKTDNYKLNSKNPKIVSKKNSQDEDYVDDDQEYLFLKEIINN
jgi:SNF2 family DNA or RNA helicase